MSFSKTEKGLEQKSLIKKKAVLEKTSNKVLMKTCFPRKPRSLSLVNSAQALNQRHFWKHLADDTLTQGYKGTRCWPKLVNHVFVTKTTFANLTSCCCFLFLIRQILLIWKRLANLWKWAIFPITKYIILIHAYH